jgi:hypothetical protein
MADGDLYPADWEPGTMYHYGDNPDPNVRLIPTNPRSWQHLQGVGQPSATPVGPQGLLHTFGYSDPPSLDISQGAQKNALTPDDPKQVPTQNTGAPTDSVAAIQAQIMQNAQGAQRAGGQPGQRPSQGEPIPSDTLQLLRKYGYSGPDNLPGPSQGAPTQQASGQPRQPDQQAQYRQWAQENAQPIQAMQQWVLNNQ